ncbi:hypothetical protein AK812_SmicGene48072, partial [Symbiodinium microadriaticum]
GLGASPGHRRSGIRALPRAWTSCGFSRGAKRLTLRSS